MQTRDAPVGPPEPLGLSTCWNASRHERVAGILDEPRRLGCRRLEAYCHFTPAQLGELAQGARDRGMEIASLHGPCPVPVDERGARAPWDDWLASPHDRERTFAVDALKRTIDTAASIRALGERAAGSGVRLGVETRDGYHEIPSLDEVAEVLAACAGLPVYYWHDAGHGAKLEYAGFVEHEAYLRRYADRLLGMHIHDTRGARDHQAPGQGDTDFAMLARYLRPGTIKTLELHATATPEQITRGVEDVLRPLG